MTFAQELKSVRKRLKDREIPVSDLVKLSGISESAWYRWQAGSRKPKRETWEKVLKAADKLAPRPAG